jgi:threonyl-tRNA synthetase
MFIVGDKEVDDEKIAVRTQSGEDLGSIDLQQVSELLSAK